MQDAFPPNSKQARTTEPREKIEPVTTAKAVGRKRGLGRKTKEAFFSGDAKSSAYFMGVEIIVPALRNLLYDALRGGLERMVYGDSSYAKRPSGYYNGDPGVGHVNYQGMSQTSPRPQQRTLSRKARSTHNFDDLVIPSSHEANDVIDRMFDMLSQYGSVTVAHLYALTGIQSDHTDMKWGWTNLRGARAVRLPKGGYLLELPPTEPLG
jgi:hypothetical protein